MKKFRWKSWPSGCACFGVGACPCFLGSFNQGLLQTLRGCSVLAADLKQFPHWKHSSHRRENWQHWHFLIMFSKDQSPGNRGVAMMEFSPFLPVQRLCFANANRYHAMERVRAKKIGVDRRHSRELLNHANLLLALVVLDSSGFYFPSPTGIISNSIWLCLGTQLKSARPK